MAPRRFPCAVEDCDTLLWHGTGMLPPGVAVCRSCRRASRAPAGTPRFGRDASPRPSAACPVCDSTFVPWRKDQKTCSRACAAALRRHGETSRPRTRGTTAQRGYGTAHQKRRAEIAPEVESGRIDCWRCTERIEPDTPWDLGHDDEDREVYRGPEHRKCNRAAAARAKNRSRRAA